MELKAKKLEEDRRIKEEKVRKRKEAEEKRRWEILRKRNEVTQRNHQKRRNELLKHHFEKLKIFHHQKQQLKTFVKACLRKPYSEPKTVLFPAGSWLILYSRKHFQ